MSDVTTPLQQLIADGLLRLGRLHGRQHEPLSLLDAYRRNVETATPPPGEKWVTYEVVRRVTAEGHTNIGRRAARTIATMLDVPVEDVLTAAGKPAPQRAPFVLPEEADALTDSERRAVLGVVDAILNARTPTPPASGRLVSEKGRPVPLGESASRTAPPAERGPGRV